MRILHVTPAFYPATALGGPIFSTYALCNALAARKDVTLKVLTTNMAGPTIRQRLDVKEIPVTFPEGYEVYQTPCHIVRDFAPSLFTRLPSLVRWADVVLLTGVYSLPTIPTLTTARFCRRPVIWSPRGALLASETWDNASRPVLKRAWERICKAVMPQRTVLHVTSEAERAASCSRLPHAETVTIPNGVNLPGHLPPRTWQPDGKLRIMFIGRLDPVKALDRLIEALVLLPSDTVHLDIYGSGNNDYANTLKSLAAEKCAPGTVTFHGHIDGLQKPRAFANADVCILPSYSENFGMAIAEALSHAVPVIASRGIPWSGVEQHTCGLWVDNDPESLAGAIQRIRQSDLATMGANGRAWMQSEFSWSGISAQFISTAERFGPAGTPAGRTSSPPRQSDEPHIRMGPGS